MSVLVCNRNGCENVMCDRFSQFYGYICHSCFAELLSKPDQSISQFMKSPKESQVDNFLVESHQEYCNEEFELV